MLRIKLFAFFVSLSLLVGAQDFSSRILNVNGRLSEVRNFELVEDSIILVGVRHDFISCHYDLLYALDLAGEMLWSKQSYEGAMDVDSNTILSAALELGDVASFFNLSVEKVDIQTGQLIDSARFYIDEFNNSQFVESGEISSLAIENGDSFLVAKGKYIARAQFEADIIEDSLLPISEEIRDVLVLKEDLIICQTQTKLYTLDANFNLLDSIPFSEDVHGMASADDEILVWHGNTVSLVSEDLQIIENLYQGDFPIRSASMRDSNLVIHSTSLEEELVVQILSTQDTFLARTPRLIAESGLVKIDSVAIFSGITFLNQAAVYSHPSYDQLDLTLEEPDIEVSSLELDSIEIFPVTGLPMYVDHFEFVPSFWVTNHGEFALDSLAVFIDLGGGVFCYDHHFYKVFRNLNLQPGEERLMTTGRLGNWSSGDVEVCVHVMAPNGRLDIDPEDNKTCVSVLITDTENPTKYEPQVFPNPVSELLHIQWTESEIDHVRVIDSRGVEVLGPARKFEGGALDVRSLPRGLYLLEISSDRRRYVHKFIKQ